MSRTCRLGSCRSTDNTWGGGQRLDPRTSRLRRLPTECIPRVLQLAGKSIEVLGQRLQLGVPRVHALKAADKLVARVVTIKHATSEVALLNAAKEQLGREGIVGDIEIRAWHLAIGKVSRVESCCESRFDHYRLSFAGPKPQ